MGGSRTPASGLLGQQVGSFLIKFFDLGGMMSGWPCQIVALEVALVGVSLHLDCSTCSSSA